MKKIYPLATFFILILTFGCKTIELESYSFDSNENYKDPGIVYSLPKNFLKIEITYTSRQEFQKINGVEIKNDKIEPDVTIDKPIKVISVLVPDEEYVFRLTGDRITNDFFAKSTLDFNLTQNGILKSIDTDVEDKSVEFGESLVLSTANIARAVGDPVSQLQKQSLIDFSKSLQFLNAKNTSTIRDNDKYVLNRLSQEFDRLNLAMINGTNIIEKEYDQILFEEIKKLNIDLITAKEKDKVNLIKSKISHLKTEIIDYQSKNRSFFKETERKYTVIIDPFKQYKSTELKTEIVVNNGVNIYNHTILPKHIFPDVKNKHIPTINISIEGNLKEENKFESDTTLINGVVVRHPSRTKVDLKIDNNLYASEVVFLGQLGNTSVLPVKVKRAGKIVTAIKFDPITGAIAQHRIEATSSSDKIGKSLEKSSKVLQETIEYLNYEKEIKELTTVKSELSLQNDISVLKAKELDRELTNLTNQEKIIVLQQKIEELNKKNDNQEFDLAIKELEQKRKILDLELKIKELQDKLNENN